MFGNFGAGDIPGQIDAYELYDAAYNWFFPKHSGITKRGGSEPYDPYATSLYTDEDYASSSYTPEELGWKPPPIVPKPGAVKPGAVVSVPSYNPDVQNQIMALAARQDAMNAQQAAFLAKLQAPAAATGASSTNTRVIVAGAVGVGALLLLLRAVR